MARLTDDERENLVAYLDGELDEKTARDLETRLNLDPEARAEADAMQQTWGLLDYLPRPEPSVSFTHRTLERLAVQTSGVGRRGVPRWLLVAGWAAAVLVAVLGGLGAAGFLWPRPQASHPNDETEFIKALSHPDLFGEDGEHADEPAGQFAQVRARYAEWLDGLEPTERTQIHEAADRESRVKLIHDLREQEWLRRQPKKVREELVSLQGEQRTRRVNEQRREERQRRHDWQVAARFWDDLQAGKLIPVKLADLPKDVQVFVNEYLRPQLSPQERDRLDRAEGRPIFPQTLVELADSHPMALLNPEHGPTHFKELPKEVQKILQPALSKKGFPKREFAKELLEAQGRWPTFAIAVAAYARKQKLPPFPHELWPNNSQGLASEARDFVANQLAPVLDDAEKKLLARAEAQGWPDYPRALNDLARVHGLQVPWQTLPEPRKWDRYRAKKPATGSGTP